MNFNFSLDSKKCNHLYFLFIYSLHFVVVAFSHKWCDKMVEDMLQMALGQESNLDI